MADHSPQMALMERTRNVSSFNSNDLTPIIYGSREAAEEVKVAFSRVHKALDLQDMSKLPARYNDTNHQAQILQGFRTGKILFEEDRDHGSTHFDFSTHTWTLANSNPLGMTKALFIPTVKLHGTDEQIAKWVPLAESGKIIGTFAQTELGHGTYVRGVQTTAAFDPETDEFVINTPCEEATKVWPGAVGYATTHVLVVAQMMIVEKDFGIHTFVVQIRSTKDFKPMPGIELGDVGSKFAYNTIDNGFISFHDVRVPRTHKLMRFSQVSRAGAYTTSPLRQRLLFGGLLFGRVAILKNAPFKLAQALTIAIRYSIVRSQGPPLSPDEPAHETSLSSYKHQQHRLVTLLAKNFALLFSSKTAVAQYGEVIEAQNNGDIGNLAEMHMLMCGLKAWATQTAADGAEDARKMCGGHGFMMISGLPDIVGQTAAACTFEGENWVLWGQVGKYLWKSLEKKTLPEGLAYVSRFINDKASPVTEFNGNLGKLQYEKILAVYQHRAAILVSRAHKLVATAINMGKAPLKAEDDHALELAVAGRAHIELYILASSHAYLSSYLAANPDTPQVLVTILYNILHLFALAGICSPLSGSMANAGFLETESVSPAQLNEMRLLVDGLVAELVPDAIALTDAWEFSDASLVSAIGCKDGDAYRRVMSWVKQFDVNVDAMRNGGIMKGSLEVVEGLLRSKL